MEVFLLYFYRYVYTKEYSTYVPLEILKSLASLKIAASSYENGKISKNITGPLIFKQHSRYKIYVLSQHKTRTQASLIKYC
jgi:hypothetical protein